MNILLTFNRIKDVQKEIGLKNIDLKIIEKIQGLIKDKYSEEIISQYSLKLQSFSFLLNYKINNISFYNSDLSSFFNNFILFIKNNCFGFNDRENNLNVIISYYLISKLNDELINKIDLNLQHTLKFNSKNLKYLQGWFYEHKNLRAKRYINLYTYAEMFGVQEANKIEIIIKSIQNFRTEIDIFNSFLLFLVKEEKSIFLEINKELLHNFMKLFFNEIVDNNKCLNSAKRVWNILIRTLTEYFNLDKNFKLSLTRKYKNPNEMNLKNINGNLVKTKLITHIPLEISDDKSLYLLKDKINQDLNLVKDWAIFNLKFFDNNKFLSRKELYSIFILLTLEHPSITESFLSTLKSQNSYIKLDNNFFLVGQKSRKGYSLAEQKILLSDFSVNILTKYLTWISEYKQGYESFFIYNGKEGIKNLSNKNYNLYNEGLKGSFKKYLIDKEVPEKYATEVVQNAYLSKLRASSAIQIYFNTESTTKMAQALGHTSYSPKLLSHYLPQSILDFYQQRWIRIFQKGLICEALKNNSLLLQASNFESMAQLNDFLRNHMLKNLPDNLSSLTTNPSVNNSDYNNIYVSINKENLTALFSLQKSIKESGDKEHISEKSYFWFHFSEQLEKEILNKREYNEFKPLLLTCKEEANSSYFNKVIYEQ